MWRNLDTAADSSRSEETGGNENVGLQRKCEFARSGGRVDPGPSTSNLFHPQNSCAALISVCAYTFCCGRYGGCRGEGANTTAGQRRVDIAKAWSSLIDNLQLKNRPAERSRAHRPPLVFFLSSLFPES